MIKMELEKEFNLSTSSSSMGHDTPRLPTTGCNDVNGAYDTSMNKEGNRHARKYNFSEALGHLKDGLAVARTGWHVQNMYLRIQKPNECSFMTLPYIYISLPREPGFMYRNRVPWLASQTDILSNDWFIVSPE